MKMKRIIGSAAAATLALSSVSSYVAFAAPLTTPATQAATAVGVSSASIGTRPTLSADGEAAVAAIGTYAVSKDAQGNVVVTFTKTKAEVQAAIAGNELLTKGSANSGVDPVYLTIVTDAAADLADTGTWSGYGWDNGSHKEWNVSGKNIMLWMPAVITGEQKTITYTVGETVVTLPIKYVYATPAAATLTSTVSTGATSHPETDPDKKARIDAIGGYTAAVSGSTVTVTFAKPKSEIEALATEKNWGNGSGTTVAPVYLKLTTSAALGTDGTWAGYGWDVTANKEYNISGTNMMLWLPATFTGNTKTIGYTPAGGSKTEFTINYVYAAEPTTSEPTTSGSGSGTTAVTPVDPVSPTTSDSTTTSGSTSTPAATVEEVKGEVTADVKVGETVTVKSDDLGGDVTVATDKEDKALEGTKLELEVTNDKTETTKELNEAVGTSASTEVKATVDAAVKAVEAGNAVTLDISFTKDGKTVQPGKDVTVTVPVPSVVKGADKLFIYHVTDKGLEDITSKCKYDKDKGTVSITNDKFSPYIISKVEIKADSAATSGDSTTTSNGGTTSNPNTGVALAMAPIILAGAAVAVVSVKKRK